MSRSSDAAATAAPSSSSSALTRAQRGGVSSLWPLLLSEDPSSRAATLPEGVTERILDEELKGCRDTLRALRLVSRAARAAVDARVRYVRVGRNDKWFGPRPPTVLEVLSRFPGLEKLRASIEDDTFGANLAGLIRGLPRLRRLKELDLTFLPADPADLRSEVAQLARALPTRLEELELTIRANCVHFEPLVDAAAALPNLRSLGLVSGHGAVKHLDEFQLLLPAVRRALQQPGAWSNLRELRLDYLDPQTYAALAAATQLTALRELALCNCSADEDTEDGRLHLLAEAPWMRQLTELRLDAFGGRDPATDDLFTGLELPTLERLSIQDFDHSATDPATGAPAGLATASLPALTSLRWVPYAERSTNLKAIAAAPWYAGLSKLSVSVYDVEDVDTERAMLRPPFTALTELRVRCFFVTRDVLDAVTAAPMLRSLRSLTLTDDFDGHSPLPDMARVDDWEAFARAPFAVLRELNLSLACLPVQSPAAIREAAWITRLTKLHLTDGLF